MSGRNLKFIVESEKPAGIEKLLPAIRHIVPVQLELDIIAQKGPRLCAPTSSSQMAFGKSFRA
jgi:hypothetical protein